MNTIEELEKEILEAKKELLKEIKASQKRSKLADMAFPVIFFCGTVLWLYCLFVSFNRFITLGS